MFLDELLELCKVKETPPGEDETVVICKGCRPGADYYLVVPNTDFEELVVRHRADEPASEAILYAIKKAKGANDDVYNRLMDNEKVSLYYQQACAKACEQVLLEIERRNPPTSPASMDRVNAMVSVQGARSGSKTREWVDPSQSVFQPPADLGDDVSDECDNGEVTVDENGHGQGAIRGAESAVGSNISGVVDATDSACVSQVGEVGSGAAGAVDSQGREPVGRLDTVESKRQTDLAAGVNKTDLSSNSVDVDTVQTGGLGVGGFGLPPLDLGDTSDEESAGVSAARDDSGFVPPTSREVEDSEEELEGTPATNTMYTDWSHLLAGDLENDTDSGAGVDADARSSGDDLRSELVRTPFSNSEDDSSWNPFATSDASSVPGKNLTGDSTVAGMAEVAIDSPMGDNNFNSVSDEGKHIDADVEAAVVSDAVPAVSEKGAAGEDEGSESVSASESSAELEVAGESTEASGVDSTEVPLSGLKDVSHLKKEGVTGVSFEELTGGDVSVPEDEGTPSSPPNLTVLHGTATSDDSIKGKGTSEASEMDSFAKQRAEEELEQWKVIATEEVNKIVGDAIQVFSTYVPREVCECVGVSYVEFLNSLADKCPPVHDLQTVDIYSRDFVVRILECVREYAMDAVRDGNEEGVDDLVKPIIRVIYEE